MKLYKLSAHRESEVMQLILAFVAVVVALLLVSITRTPTQADPVASPVSARSAPESTTPPSAIGLRSLAASSLMDDALQARLDAEEAARYALQDMVDAQNEQIAAEIAARDEAQHLVDQQNEALAAQQEAANAAAEAVALAEPTPITTPTAPVEGTAGDPITTPPAGTETPTPTDTPPTDTPPTGDPGPILPILGLI